MKSPKQVSRQTSLLFETFKTERVVDGKWSMAGAKWVGGTSHWFANFQCAGCQRVSFVKPLQSIASTIEEFGVKVYQKKLEAFSTLKCVKIEKDLNRSQHRDVENCKY